MIFLVRIIVNADDFGYSKEHTLGVCKLHDDKFLSRTTIMVNMPDYDYAVNLAKESSIFSKTGLHLNITYGEPLTNEVKKFPGFCNAYGKFNAVFHKSTKGRLLIGKDASKALEIEMRAQIEKYLSDGFTLMHMDSHRHIHTDYSIFRILEPLINEYSFQSLRISRNLPQNNRIDKRIYKKLVNTRIKNTADTTDYFTDTISFEKNISQIPDTASVEIMLHPILRENTGDYTDFDTYPMSRIYEVLSPFYDIIDR